jgi:hypothetical protein
MTNKPYSKKYNNKSWLEEQNNVLKRHVNEIADEIGCTPATVSRWMKSYGIIPIRKYNGRSGPENPMYGKRGKLSPNYGRHMSEENKKKMSERMIGKYAGDLNPAKRPEVRAKLHKPKTEEHKRKISESSKGKSGKKGWHHTEETKQRISETHKGELNGMYGRSGVDAPNYGKPMSDETKRKLSLSHIGLNTGKDHYMYGKPSPPKSGRGKGSYFDLQDGSKVWLKSTYETRFAIALTKLGILWEYEIQSFELDCISPYHPDFYLPEYNLWIEVKGYLNDKAREKLNQFVIKYPKEKLRMIYEEDIIIIEYAIDNNILIDINNIGSVYIPG